MRIPCSILPFKGIVVQMFFWNNKNSLTWYEFWMILCLACFMFCAAVSFFFFLFSCYATQIEYWIITSSLHFLRYHLVFLNDVLEGKLFVDKRKCHFQVPRSHEWLSDIPGSQIHEAASSISTADQASAWRQRRWGRGQLLSWSARAGSQQKLSA